MSDDILLMRGVTFHKIALARGSKLDAALVLAIFNQNDAMLLSNETGVLLPFKTALAVCRNAHNKFPDIAQMPGFEAFLVFLETLVDKEISWLILDTKEAR